MSSRQQVKFLMQKTQQEENWDMDNDSDLRGGSGKYLFLAVFLARLILILFNFRKLRG